MAVDKKSQHVGNHGGAYTDIDGMSKQFTYVDHDKKTKISTHKSESLEELRKAHINHVGKQVTAMLALPAINVVRNQDGLFEEFIIRDKDKGVIWNEDMVWDACTINSLLLHNMWIQVWKTSVKEQYWFEDISYDDIAKGEWKKWS